MTTYTYTTEELHAMLLDWRGIEPGRECRDCGGSGVKAYANTATWHNAAIAGQAITNDVCDSCWGSGDRTRPWANLRNLLRRGVDLR